MSKKYRVNWKQEVVQNWTGTTDADSVEEALENVKEGNVHEAELVDTDEYHTFEETVEGEEEKILKCENCGKFREDVRNTSCPYAAEINGEDVPMTLCEQCYSNRADDI